MAVYSKVAGLTFSEHGRALILIYIDIRCVQSCRSIWFEAATVVAVPPPVEISAGSVLKSALAGGLSCALSTSLMHPIDTMKARLPPCLRLLLLLGIDQNTPCFRTLDALIWHDHAWWLS